MTCSSGSAESAISLATTAEFTAARAVAAESALALVDAAAYIGGELIEAAAESALGPGRGGRLHGRAGSDGREQFGAGG